MVTGNPGYSHVQLTSAKFPLLTLVLDCRTHSAATFERYLVDMCRHRRVFTVASRCLDTRNFHRVLFIPLPYRFGVRGEATVAGLTYV